MRALAAGLLAFWVCTAAAQALRLEEVLAHADGPHPDLDAARAQHELARAEQALAESLSDFRVVLEAALITGRNELYDDRYHADNFARLNARKTLWDAGRHAATLRAARLEHDAQVPRMQDIRAQRRLALMNRFFDVLITDLQYAVENEYLAVAYVNWDNGRERHQLGQLSTHELLELEHRYQEWRLRRNDTERKARERRALLASAMNRPGELPAALAEPVLSGNARRLPPFDDLLTAMQTHNPGLRTWQGLLAAAQGRLQAARLEDQPRLELALEAGSYTRPSATRDDLRAGLNFAWPLYDGRRLDARLALEQARFQALQAEYEQLRLDLRQRLYETWQEIQYLRDVERPALAVDAEYREHALERARAEYELELKTNLGNSMADTQSARLRQRAAEYRLALAWERLDILVGMPLESGVKGGEQ
jgi:outer membrane protein TolC